jgi:hypothetical protein
MSKHSEDFSRALIDQLLETSCWDLTSSQQIKFESSRLNGRAESLFKAEAKDLKAS